ncbi:MAG: hypothetical protein NVS9B1_27590 [Candidatus Dormibacteraceae bacterium]
MPTLTPVPGWRRLLLLGLPLLAGAAVLAAVMALGLAAPAPAAPAPGAPLVALPPPSGLLVHVSGAVLHPGLYRLQRGDRLYVALAAAGGLAPGADPDRTPDLAARLRDGQQVKVPFKKGSGGSRVGRVDINSATAEELAAVPGFTPALAAEVVDYRARFGPFTKVSDLVAALAMSRADYALARAHLEAR